MRPSVTILGLFLSASLALAPLSAATAQSSDGHNRRVVIVNNSSQYVYRVYASNVDATSWEEDMLRDKVINPGEQKTFNIDDGTGYCKYDLKVIMYDNQTKVQTPLTRSRVNVCSVESWTIND